MFRIKHIFSAQLSFPCSSSGIFQFFVVGAGDPEAPSCVFVEMNYLQLFFSSLRISREAKVVVRRVAIDCLLLAHFC